MTTFAPTHALCLVDLSPLSATVLSWARLFARHFPMDFEIFHAAWSGAPKENATEGDDEMRQTELHATVERLASEGIGPSSHRVSVQEGHPLLLVLERLDKGIPGLIVLGSHGYDGLARSMMGSV